MGIFGSPTFAVGNELFWGDDRLTDAVNWRERNKGHVAGAPHVGEYSPSPLMTLSNMRELSTALIAILFDIAEQENEACHLRQA